jgi:hypothetical protein
MLLIFCAKSDPTPTLPCKQGREQKRSPVTEESRRQAYFKRAAIPLQPLSNAAFHAAPASVCSGRTQRSWIA